MMAAGAALALALWLLLPPVGVEGAGPPPIQDGEFTFLLPAGRKQCFYQSAPANASLETEYQVEGPESGSTQASGARARGRGQAAETRHGLKREGEEPVRMSAGAELGGACRSWSGRCVGAEGVGIMAGGGVRARLPEGAGPSFIRGLPSQGRNLASGRGQKSARLGDLVGVAKMRHWKGRGQHEAFSGPGLRKAGPCRLTWGVAR